MLSKSFCAGGGGRGEGSIFFDVVSHSHPYADIITESCGRFLDENISFENCEGLRDVVEHPLDSLTTFKRLPKCQLIRSKDEKKDSFPMKETPPKILRERVCRARHPDVGETPPQHRHVSATPLAITAKSPHLVSPMLSEIAHLVACSTKLIFLKLKLILSV